MTRHSAPDAGFSASGIATTMLAVAIAIFGSIVATSLANAQAYPSKSIRIIVPFTPGGGNDVLARIVGQHLTEAWGHPVVVDNRPGAGGNIGADAAAKSAPDGYTFLVAANNVLTINPTLNKATPFDPIKDFAPVGMMGAIPILLSSNPKLPAKSVAELIALGKSKPGRLTYGSAGPGTPHHLSAELFASMTGLTMQHVPYRGATPLIADLLSGQIDIAFGAINSMLPLAKAGKLRPLGVAGAKRLSYLPDVPTIAETVPGYETDIWIALVAPAGTPKDVIAKINGEMLRILSLPGVRAKLAAQGIEAGASTPERLAEITRSDLARWAKVIEAAKIGGK